MYLTRHLSADGPRWALDFPRGVFLMTGTGIVPPPEYTLSPGDRVRVTVGSLTLENDVERAPRIPQC